LGLTTLEVRRKRGDLIQLYKIKNGVEEVDIDIGGGNQGGYQGRTNYQGNDEKCAHPRIYYPQI